MFEKGHMPRIQFTNYNINFGFQRKTLIESCQWFLAHFPKEGGNISRFATTDKVKDNNDWTIPKLIKNE